MNPQHYDTAHMATSSDSQTILIYNTSFNRVVAPSQQHWVVSRSTSLLEEEAPWLRSEKGGVKVPGLIDGPKRELNSEKEVHRIKVR